MAPDPRPVRGVRLVDRPDPGASRFASLPVARQREALGPAKFQAYATGQVRLTDFVARHSDPRWGRSTRAASLAEARANAARRERAATT